MADPTKTTNPKWFEALLMATFYGAVLGVAWAGVTMLGALLWGAVHWCGRWAGWWE